MAEQPWLPAKWDRQADVVVVGFGAAGAATAITAYDAGAQVVLLDKAPQGHEGGNTRVAGQGYLNTAKVPEFRATFSMVALHFAKEQPGGMIVVGPDGKRFTDEKYKTSHGKVHLAGRWTSLSTPCPMCMICDHTLFASGPLYEKEPRSGWNPIVERYDWSADNEAELAKGWIKQAETIAALAQTIGLNPAVLEETVSRWKAHCHAGADTDFGRTRMLSPVQAAPFYAVALSPSMLNTQGGPRRNARGQIVRPDGSPIPRLYSAGELGSIYSYLYQGTGNIGECLAFGRIAGRNAVAEQPWR